MVRFSAPGNQTQLAWSNCSTVRCIKLNRSFAIIISHGRKGNFERLDNWARPQKLSKKAEACPPAEAVLHVVLHCGIVETHQACRPAQTQVALRLSPIHPHSSFWSRRSEWGLKMFVLILLPRASNVQEFCSILHFLQMANSSETRVTEAFSVCLRYIG